MNNLLYQLLELHEKPLLLLQSNGLLEKANKSACSLWPDLQYAAGKHLWQFGEVAQEQALSFLSRQRILPISSSAGSSSANTDTLVDNSADSLVLSSKENTESLYQLQLAGTDGNYVLLEVEKRLQLEIELPATAEISLDFLNAILNGISDQMMAVLDINMRYITFNEAYKQEYARIFAVDVNVGDSLMDTLQHLPGEQEKVSRIWEIAIRGEEFSLKETFGHSSLSPTTYSLTFFPLKDSQGQLLGVLYRVKDLSREQLMEGLLRDSEERFRTLAENTPDIVIRYGTNMQVLFANTATEHSIGLTPASLTDKSLFQLPIINKIPESYILKIQQTLETGEEKDVISSYEHEGALSDYYTHFIPEKNAAGDVVSVIAISRNISDLHEAQKELQQARDFIFMAEVIPQLIWITEANGDASFFNQHWYDYTGLSKEESMFWGWQIVVHPDDLQQTITEWQQSLQRKEPYQVEYRLRRYDGSYRWFLAKAMPMKDADENVLKWYGFCADIHEHKQNRTELAERAQELQLLNQMIPQIVWATKPDGYHDYFNQRWFEYTGFAFDDSKDQGWADALHPEDYERTLEVWNHCLESGEPYQIEYRFRRYDGAYRWFITRATPLRDGRGHIVKWFGTCTDIHDQKQQSDALSQKNYELQQINAYLDQFVHTAAHDLRSPVANMKLLYEMLLREENPDKHKKLLDTFKPLLNRLDNTIIGLVEIVQMQEGHSALRVQEVDPQQILQDVKDEFSEKLQEIGASLEEKIVLEKPLYYLKPYFQSIIRNLLSNSIKFRHPDRPLRIKVVGEWQGKHYLLSVTDNGSGIDLQRNNKNLFRPFKRLSQQGEGLGIGLHMVQNMVSKNGGYIEVNSQLGVGSTFSLFLYPYEH